MADKLVNVDTANFEYIIHAKTDFIFMTKPNVAKRKIIGKHEDLTTKDEESIRSDHPILWFIYKSTVVATKLKGGGSEQKKKFLCKGGIIGR